MAADIARRKEEVRQVLKETIEKLSQEINVKSPVQNRTVAARERGIRMHHP